MNSIITIGRQFGSQGREIGMRVAKRLGINCYDKDLLARAGYALSPCDKTDIIFSYFIENGIYDMIELDIQLEEHGLPCIISICL